jgi:hypothetical protein
MSGLATQFGNAKKEKKPKRTLANQVRGEKFKDEESTFDNLVNLAKQATKRQVGLTGRAAVEGALAIPMLAGDAVNTAINLGTGAVDRFAGTDIPKLGMPSQELQRGLNTVLPQPENFNERVANIAAQAMTGAGLAKAAVPLVKNLPKAVSNLRGQAPQLRQQGPAIPRTAVEELAAAPKTQVAGATAAQLGTEAALGAGVTNPLALAAIGLGAGAGTAAPQMVLKRAGESASQPFTRKGQEIIAGRALLRTANEPGEGLIQRLEGAEEIVPGSRPTTAAVSRDPGIQEASEVIRAMETGFEVPGISARRNIEQSIAREEALAKILPDETAIETAEQVQKTIYPEMVEPQIKRAKKVKDLGRDSDTNPMLAQIDEIANRPGGKTPQMTRTLKQMRKLITNKDVDLTNAEDIYESIRKPLLDMESGSLGKNPLVDSAKRAVREVIRVTDDVLEPVVPGYKKYLQTYAQSKAKIERLQQLLKFRNKLYTASPINEAVGTPSIKPSISKVIRDNLKAASNLTENLAPEEYRILRNVEKDINMGNQAGTQQVGTKGSPTFKNLSVANAVGRFMSEEMQAVLSKGKVGTALRTTAAPFSWMTQVADREIGALIAQALLEPKMAAAFMRKATDANLKTASDLLLDNAINNLEATALYQQN